MLLHKLTALDVPVHKVSTIVAQHPKTVYIKRVKGTQPTMNNLYIINEVLSDYTSGMAVVAAPSLERCREVFENGIEYALMGEYDSAIEDGDYKVIENVNHPEGVVSYTWGGG